MGNKWDTLGRRREWDLINGDWINKNTGTRYDKNGFDVTGIHKDTLTGYDQEGYDNSGFDKDGYDRYGFDKKRIHRDTLTEYDPDGYDGWWGLDKDGYNGEGYNREGINRAGFDKKGIHKDTLTEYDTDGFDKNGYDKEGYNRKGIDKTGKNREERKEIQNRQRAMWLGLRRKAEALAKGEMTIEEYIMKSKMSIEELIEFAKKNNLSADVIRGLRRFIKPYQVYTRPFSKKEYLFSTTLIIDEKEVKPTEQDVDMAIEYLKAKGSLVCDKTVNDTVRRYLKGEIDITQRSEETVKQELIKKIVEQQKTIAGQQAEISRLKSQKKEL